MTDEQYHEKYGLTAERIERIILLHDVTNTKLCRLYAIDMIRHAHVVEIDADGRATRALKFDDRDFEAEIDWTDEV